MLTTSEAAERVGLTQQAVTRAIMRGSLPAVTVAQWARNTEMPADVRRVLVRAAGDRWLVRAEDCDRYWQLTRP